MQQPRFSQNSGKGRKLFSFILIRFWITALVPSSCCLSLPHTPLHASWQDNEHCLKMKNINLSRLTATEQLPKQEKYQLYVTWQLLDCWFVPVSWCSWDEIAGFHKEGQSKRDRAFPNLHSKDGGEQRKQNEKRRRALWWAGFVSAPTNCSRTTSRAGKDKFCPLDTHFNVPLHFFLIPLMWGNPWW